MKFPWEDKYKKLAITAFLTIAASILFYMILDRWSSVWGVISLFIDSLEPIIYGLILAYLLNPLMNIIECRMMLPAMKKVFSKDPERAKKFARGLSIFVAWLLALAFIVALVALIFPEIYESVESFIRSVPQYSENIMEEFNEIMEKNPSIANFFENLKNNFSTDTSSILESVQEWLPNVNVLLTRLTNSVSAVLTVVLNLVVGIIVSVYVLKDKEKFTAQFKRIFYSTMSYKKANNVIAFWRLTHEKFGSFIIGKTFDSMIIGVLCFLILTVVNMPYAALVSVIVGVTNVIPFFGPFVGAAAGGVLILLVDPLQCLTFLLIALILQQFDGNILGPKILGTTTGISSFWVIFSILVGSGLFGVWGMICAVPVFAVIYTLVKDGCHYLLRKKGIDYSSETYQKIDHIDEDTEAPVWLKKE